MFSPNPPGSRTLTDHKQFHQNVEPLKQGMPATTSSSKATLRGRPLRCLVFAGRGGHHCVSVMVPQAMSQSTVTAPGPALGLLLGGLAGAGPRPPPAPLSMFPSDELRHLWQRVSRSVDASNNNAAFSRCPVGKLPATASFETALLRNL